MIAASSSSRHQGALKQIQAVRDHLDHKKSAKDKGHKSDNQAPASSWFTSQLPPVSRPVTDAASPTPPPAALPGNDSPTDDPAAPLTADEQKLLDRRHKEAGKPRAEYGNTPVIEPSGKSKKHKSSHAKHKPKSPKHTVTQTPDPAILSYAKDNNLSVGTIAHEINQKHEPEIPEGEVIVPLR
jgi:hypothetical protein